MLVKNISFKLFTLYLMSVFYVYVGLKHFFDPNWFVRIMPPYLPFHLELVYISGAFEILFGLMLPFKKFRPFASYSLILLLIAVFPANIYLAQTNGAAMNIAPFVAWMRLPFQFIFILIAYWHSKI